jgi:ribokinase
MPADVVVFGQLARDLVLVIDDVPGAGQSAPVRQRLEILGGKGANQAVALAQLGTPSALVAVAGDDAVGSGLLRQAKDDGIDVSATVRRARTRTGLIVDVIDGTGRWRYLEQLPPPVLLTPDDVLGAVPLLADAQWASIQLQQPPEAVLTAARAARLAGCTVVLDGAPEGGQHRDELLANAAVVRADARETRLLAGTAIEDLDDARRAAAEIMRHGPHVVALAVGDAGNYFAWRGGDVLLPLSPVPLVDTTGAGDALTAALIAGLRAGYAPERVARLAVAAAAATVGHPGGRPRLTGAALARQVKVQEQAIREGWRTG